MHIRSKHWVPWATFLFSFWDTVWVLPTDISSGPLLLSWYRTALWAQYYCNVNLIVFHSRVFLKLVSLYFSYFSSFSTLSFILWTYQSKWSMFDEISSTWILPGSVSIVCFVYWPHLLINMVNFGWMLHNIYLKNCGVSGCCCLELFI